MKISRDQLKQLVKECLVEILANGLGGNLTEQIQRKSVNSVQTIRQQPKNAFLDTPVSRKQQPTNALKEAIKIESGGNSILADIFADTAATTLQKQMAHSTPSGGALSPAAGAVEMLVAQAEPEQLFGEEAAGKWAALAFADSPNKNA